MKKMITTKTEVEAVCCDRCGRAPALKVEIFVDRRDPLTKAFHSSDLCNDCTDLVVKTARVRRKRKIKASEIETVAPCEGTREPA